MTSEQQTSEQQTSEQQTYIDEKIKQIDLMLENVNLTEERKQILLEERAEYEEQSEELYDTESEEDIQYESVYFKYWFENCKTIDEVLSGIEGLKQTFEQWKKEGHELTIMGIVLLIKFTKKQIKNC